MRFVNKVRGHRGRSSLYSSTLERIKDESSFEKIETKYLKLKNVKGFESVSMCSNCDEKLIKANVASNHS